MYKCRDSGAVRATQKIKQEMRWSVNAGERLIGLAVFFSKNSPIPYSYKISTSHVKHGFAGFFFFFLVVLIENILIILPFKLSSPCKLLHLEWINYKVLRYSTGNYIVDLIIIHLEVESYVLFSGNF